MTGDTAAWLALMTVPIILVTVVMPRADRWFDRRRAEKRATAAVREQRERETEQHRIDSEFLEIVTTRLADVGMKGRRDE